MSDDNASDLPDDPFEMDVPGFEAFTGPKADEIREFAREFAAAKYDYSALLHQQSFHELRTAIGALTDAQVRAVLLRAVVTSVHRHMNDYERFVRWVEKQ
jgi:hypothetical protein